MISGYVPHFRKASLRSPREGRSRIAGMLTVEVYALNHISMHAQLSSRDGI